MTIFLKLLMMSVFANASCLDGYECLKQADFLKEEGYTVKASMYYKQACDFGIAVACSEKLPVTNAFKGFDSLESCLSSNGNAVKCISVAIEFRKASLAKYAVQILDQFCSKENGNACFELGTTHLNNKDFELASSAFLKSCTYGVSKSCEVSKSVSGQMQFLNQKDEFERQKKRDDEEDKRRIAAERANAAKESREQFQKDMERIGKAFERPATPKKTKCEFKNVYGGISSECTEE